MNSLTSLDISVKSLLNTQLSLTTKLEQLTTGNKDSSRNANQGVYLSSTLRSDQVSRRKAMNNTQQGLSVLETAEGGYSEIYKNLTRLKELATQSANGTYSSTERDQMNTEYAHLLRQIDRIANTTTYNGHKLLAASTIIDVGIIVDKSNSMGGTISDVITGLLNFDKKFRDSSVHMRMGINTLTNSGTSKYFELGDPNGNLTGLTDVEPGRIDPYSSILESIGAISSGVEFSFHSDVTAKNVIYITDVGREIDVIGADDFAETESDIATELINRDIRFHSVHAIASTDTGDIATLTGGIGAKKSQMTASLESIADNIINDVTVENDKLSLQIGIGNNSAVDQLLLSHSKDMTTFGLGIHSSNISSQEGALAALDKLETGLTNLTNSRATSATEHNRLTHVLSSLTEKDLQETQTISKMSDFDIASIKTEFEQLLTQTRGSASIMNLTKNINLNTIQGLLNTP